MKKVFVTRPLMPSFEEYSNEIKDLWNSLWITNMGEKHERLQEELEAYLNVDHVELFVNGHMALEMAIQGLGISGEVITTPYTFASTTHAIVRNGLTPVFCDVDPEDYTIDVSKIENLITEKTEAIIPVHVYGNICNIEAIDGIAKKYNLKVVYDAAHAFGESYKGKGIGSFGDASCFSFHATKVFNTIEGGAVCYSNDEFGAVLYGLKNFGIRGPETVDAVGANAKMNEFSAAMGLCNLRHIDESIEKRRIRYNHYMDRLSNIDGLKLNTISKDVEPNFAYFPVVVDSELFGCTRDEVLKALSENDIEARKYFYPITTEFECYNDIYNKRNTPVAEELSRKVLTLPLYSELSFETIDSICDILISCRK